MSDVSSLDSLIGPTLILANGTSVTRRRKINFSGFTASDDAGLDATTIEAPAVGGDLTTGKIYECTTLDDTPTELVEIPYAANALYQIIIEAVATDASGNTGDCGAWVRRYVYQCEDGVYNNKGVASAMAEDFADDVSWEVSLLSSEGGPIRVVAVGDSADATKFTALIRVQTVIP